MQSMASSSSPQRLVSVLLLFLLLFSFSSILESSQFCDAGIEHGESTCGVSSSSSSTKLLIKGGTVVNVHDVEVADVYVQGGINVTVKPIIKVGDDVIVLDATGKLVMPAQKVIGEAVVSGLVLNDSWLCDTNFITAAKHVMSPSIRAAGHDKALQVAISMGVLQLESGQISLTDYVWLTNTECARAFNISPRKGGVREGSDADIIILNPNSSFGIVRSGTTLEQIPMSTRDGKGRTFDFVWIKTRSNERMLE